MTRSPDAAPSTADLLPPEETELLTAWSSGPAGDLTGGLVHELITRRAKADPDGVAVSFMDRTMTFRQLDERSEGIAAELRARGAGQETVVGVRSGVASTCPPHCSAC